MSKQDLVVWNSDQHKDGIRFQVDYSDWDEDESGSILDDFISSDEFKAVLPIYEAISLVSPLLRMGDSSFTVFTEWVALDIADRLSTDEVTQFDLIQPVQEWFTRQ